MRDILIKKLAFKVAYRELSKCSMCAGHYSGSPSAERFMYGVATVMESIAYFAGGDKLADKCSSLFTKNMVNSEKNWEAVHGKQGEVSGDMQE